MMSERKKLTEEQKRIIVEKRRQTLMERYGNPNYNNLAKCKQTKLERYGDENYNNMEKNKQTCLEKYGFKFHNQNEEIRAKISSAKKSTETQQKYENTMVEKYGQPNVNLIPEIREKYTKTLLEHYNVTNPLKNEEIYKKHIETMMKNKSYNTSKFEESYYEELCQKYGKEDVIRQYSDSRYPFKCDFYVKSEDLFIEINKHPSHYTHPFDPTNINDIELLEELKQNNNEWSNMIIDVWTIRDVHKQQIAMENHLNYKVIY